MINGSCGQGTQFISGLTTRYPDFAGYGGIIALRVSAGIYSVLCSVAGWKTLTKFCGPHLSCPILTLKTALDHMSDQASAQVHTSFTLKIAAAPQDTDRAFLPFCGSFEGTAAVIEMHIAQL